MKRTLLSLTAVGLLLAASGARAEGPAAMGRDASGIMVHDGSAYIVQRLGTELTLSDGTKISPEGNVMSKDGGLRPIKPGQLLSPSGELRLSPFSTGGEGAQLAPEPGGFLSTPLSPSFPGMQDTTEAAASGGMPQAPTPNGDFSD